jgi:hypothetical protein
MVNKSEYLFTDISSEQFRAYVFETGVEVKIDSPEFLSVSRSGGHRILDANKVSHYVPNGWVHLYWKAKDGSPNFVK